MRKLFKENLDMPEYERLHSKIFSAKIGISIAMICVYLLIMSTTAYAYFSCSITSGNNTLRAAHYDLTITTPDGIIPDEDGFFTLSNTSYPSLNVMSILADDETVSGNEMVSASGNDVMTVEETGSTSGNDVLPIDEIQAMSLDAENFPDNSEEFQFTLTKSGTATTGYCKIIVIHKDGKEEIFYTQPIGQQKSGEETITVDELTVTITVPTDTVRKVKFIPQWGSCSATEKLITQTNNEIKPMYHAAKPNQNP